MLKTTLPRLNPETTRLHPRPVPAMPNQVGGSLNSPHLEDLVLMNHTENILVVERDPALGDWLRHTLRGQHSGVCTATNLREARGWLNVALGFIAVVCEEELEDGAAWDLLDWLRHEKQNEIPFLMMCAQPPPFSPSPGLELLGKPFDATQLHQALHRLLLPA